MRNVFVFSFFIAISISIVSCSIYKYGKGEINDSKKRFIIGKDYIYNLALNGVVVNKNICNKCNVDKYTIDIKLLYISKKPSFTQLEHPRFYSIKNDSILTISISQKLYEKLIEKDHISKESQSFNLKIDDVDIPLISIKTYEWLP